MQNPVQVLNAVLIGLLCGLGYYLYKFYSNRKNYPPGPFPLPILGNVLKLREKKHVHEIFRDIGKQYNGVFTMYIGNKVQVVITDPHLSLEVLKKHQFAGRPQMQVLIDLFLVKDSIDVIFSDFNKEWEVLRKVSHTAVRKYAVSDKFPSVCSDVVDEVVESMMNKDSKEIDMRQYLSKTVYTILSISAFGKKYTLDDPELLKWIDASEIQQRRNTDLMLMEFIPFAKYFMKEALKDFQEIAKFQHHKLRKNHEEHLESLDRDNMRDFTDAMLSAMKVSMYFSSLSLINLFPKNDNMTTGSRGRRRIRYSQVP